MCAGSASRRRASSPSARATQRTDCSRWRKFLEFFVWEPSTNGRCAKTSGTWTNGPSSARDALVKVGVLAGSLLAALLATVVLRVRNGVYRRMEEDERRDTDADGVPDVYQRDAIGE